MPVDIHDLPPAYQAQVAKKLVDQMRRRPLGSSAASAKYHNVKDVRHVKSKSIKFDSKKEARRYDELMAMLRAGAIQDLRLQVEFTLQEAYTTPTGERVRAIRYKADFTYTRGGEFVVEDTKSPATRKDKVYQLKRKLMMDRKGIKILET